MKITGISVYQVDLPLVDHAYKWADGKGGSQFDSTVVQIHTDAGITGYGEVNNIQQQLSQLKYYT